MTVSLETQQRIAILRQKGRDGTLTLEDAKEGIAFLRAERMMMEPAKASGSKKVVIDENSLLGELGI